MLVPAPASRRPARGARQGPRIGLLVESLSDRFWHEIVLAVDAAAARHGVQLFVFVGGTLDAPEIAARQANRCYQLASSACLDGLIVAPLGSSAGPERLAQYCERYRPLPMSAVTAVVDNMPSVCTDNVQSMRQAVSHVVVEHGARRVAFIRGPRVNAEAEMRYRGYRESLLEHGLTEDPRLVLEGDFSEQSGSRVIRELGWGGSAPFDALVAANDSMAIGALGELTSRGVRVPDRLLVVGFDDVPEGRWGKPSLSTVRQSLYNLAEVALSSVLRQLTGKPCPPLTQVAGELVLRESCGCRAAFDRSTGHPRMSIAARPVVPNQRAAEVFADIVSAGDDLQLTAARQRLSLLWQEAVEGRANGELASGLGEAMLELSASGQELGDWQRMISGLRELCQGAPARATEEELHACRVSVGHVAERKQAALRIRSEAVLHEAIAAGSDVLGSFSQEGMFDALARHFPALMLDGCWVSLYEPALEFPPRYSRLMFAYRDGQRVALPPGGVEFETRSLAPAELLPRSNAALAVSPLFFGDSAMGTVTFALAPVQGQIYDWLREQISVALEGARLIERVEQEVAERQRAERQRLAHELDLAARIQASVLPQSVAVRGLDISARMLPATEVGGDCYDVLPFYGGAWLSIGDVAGHGLGPGVVMMMLQSSVAAVLESNPAIEPAAALSVVNSVMFDNVKRRLGQDEHATLMLLRYEDGGRFVFAGAHEEPLIYRAQTGCAEFLPAPGLWIATRPDVSSQMPESEGRLNPGDVLVLYTDGAIEAMNSQREQFGVERLARELCANPAAPAEAIRDHLLDCVRRWTDKQRDDITLLVVKRLEPAP
jgi:sigma-B regulation protein RsbU (phosphoserine phosphatase)